MWNNPQALNRLTGAAIVAALAMSLAGLLSRAANMDTFAVGQIHLVGDVAHVTREQVETIVIDELKGTFFTVDLVSARAAFEKLPWVRRVDIRRRWPNRLEVAVEEHRELARWGNTALVNTYGEMFEGASNKRLPVFEAPAGTHAEVAKHYRQFNEVLAPIGRGVHRIELSERRAWRLYLDDGTVVELGRDGVVARLEGFVGVYGRSVAELSGGVRYVDLRYANGFAVRVSNQKRSETKA